MREEFLHHIWKFGLFNKRQLCTTEGKAVDVLEPGTHNHHAGPDFFNAKVNVDNTTWAGNVEIHVCEKDWNQHGHQRDEAYNNVVLHVVYHADGESVNQMGNGIPVVELAGRISRKQLDLYESFLASKQFIPCQSQVAQVDELLISGWLERLVIERLERKSKAVLERLNRNRGDWQQTFFEQLAVNFGFKTNALPMEVMAQSIPVKLLAKCRHSVVLLEALIFGQAGFLDEQWSDDYPRQLQNEYAFLRSKHKLTPMRSEAWKFGRMRPANFPTIRLAQLASLVHQSEGLFASMMKIPSARELTKLFDVRASDYWSKHHHFDKQSVRSSSRQLGVSSRENLLINTVVPFLFAYSKQLDDYDYVETALTILDQLPPEKNSTIEKMTKIGFPAGNAARSQALLELKTRYCDRKKCLNCAVGSQLLKSISDD